MDSRHASVSKSRLARTVFLRLCRACGLFALSRRLTVNGLRILGYHGFSRDDECDFRPGLFMRPETFAARLEYLRSHGYKVLDLDEALCRLAIDTLPSSAVVITIDDGFAGTASFALPLLRAFRMPATIYVTTYYAAKE